MKKATTIWALVLLISLLQKDFFDLCGGGGGAHFLAWLQHAKKSDSFGFSEKTHLWCENYKFKNVMSNNKLFTCQMFFPLSFEHCFDLTSRAVRYANLNVHLLSKLSWRSNRHSGINST